MRTIDYIIVGQGLAGSALAWELTQRGRSVIVIDEPARNRSSAIAAGIFNPITGKVMTRTWLAEKLFPFLNSFYAGAEKILNKKFHYPLSIYRPFVSDEESKLWKVKSLSADVDKFLKACHTTPAFGDRIHDSFGGIDIAESGYVDVVAWMAAMREYLIESESYRSENFDETLLKADETIDYKDITAGKIIFCNGVGALDSKWFGWLPIKPLKGETMKVSMPLGSDRIFSRGVFIVPTGNENVYTVGSTYIHQPFSEGVTQEGREGMGQKLQVLVKPAFEIVHQDWGIRPTTPDRRPMLGAHPANKNVIIFNGLGTKGVSLAPYFAHQISDWIEGKSDLLTEVNINRFKPLYSG